MIDIYIVSIISATVGMLVGFFVKPKHEVPIKDYEKLLNKYEKLCSKLHKAFYIGATYTNGYLDVIVFDFDEDVVWYIIDKNCKNTALQIIQPINALDIELFNEKFRLKEE